MAFNQLYILTNNAQELAPTVLIENATQAE
jgi:hypothetical protein